ncbi:glycine--tRNA ligase, mitochondrial 1-like [Bidens hawaiensis]|uniref:glycine--tRNA ligase, mitochondrial 1-like n=1 Tax=Bidens hawaiensis TaxID=980011 RepID=UPI004049C1E3
MAVDYPASPLGRPCPCVTPDVVLKASGHVDKFTDLMVKDDKTGNCYRADHLLKDYCKDKLENDPTMSADKAAELKHALAVLDDLSGEQLGAKIKEYGIVAPDTKNPLSDPYPFNLMFQTQIGPSGASTGYMRPETAQGIFVNFKDLYYYNGNKLPFAAAQIGQAFRNEISPRQGLLRVREFTLAEIEHFVDPDDKSHPKYSQVSGLEFLMFPRDEQMSGQSAKKLRLGEAVSKGIVNNQTLAYFIGRVYLFLTRLGIDKNRLRFRQHLPNEMAHYAADCWDAEIELSYGWIECVGIADRSAYDLRGHTDKSGVALVAQEKFAEPKEVEKLVITPAKKELGLIFKGSQKMVVEALEAMNEKEALDMKAALETKGEVEFEVCTLQKTVIIKKHMVTVAKEIKKEHQRVFTPSVIEPSFGIGRIIYCLYEHQRPGDEQLNVFRFLPHVAPIKCSVFPLVQKQEYEEVAKQISKSLTPAGISNKKDTTDNSLAHGYYFIGYATYRVYNKGARVIVGSFSVDWQEHNQTYALSGPISSLTMTTCSTSFISYPPISSTTNPSSTTTPSNDPIHLTSAISIELECVLISAGTPTVGNAPAPPQNTVIPSPPSAYTTNEVFIEYDFDSSYLLADNVDTIPKESTVDVQQNPTMTELVQSLSPSNDDVPSTASNSTDLASVKTIHIPNLDDCWELH